MPLSKWPIIQRVLTRPRLLLDLTRMLIAGRRSTQIRVEDLKLEQSFGMGNGTWAALSGTSYEKELKEALAMLKPGDNFVDLGANIGAYTLRVAQKLGSTSRIVAVEPNPELVRTLKRNLALNQFDFVDVIEGAAGAAIGECNLIWEGQQMNAGSVAYPPCEVSWQSAKVKRVVMDEELERLGVGRVHMIKMDIEGSELDALHGLKKTLKRDRPYILFENSHAEPREYLRNLNYKLGVFQETRFFETESGHNLWAIPK
jgi:FkbM family methyltransferase